MADHDEYSKVALELLFEVRSGDYHAVTKELDEGSTPLVSCGDVNHGLVGFFDIPRANRYRDAITVAYNGQPLTAKYRPYEFGAKDDVGVLVPRQPMTETTLVFITALLNARRWRYSYGRKCFKRKLEGVEVEVPLTVVDGLRELDETRIASLLSSTSPDLRPAPHASDDADEGAPTIRWENKRLDDLFELERGDFHSLKPLAKGTLATVSRTEADNGVVGYFERPHGSKVYPAGLITVSSVTGDAFVQAEEFIATDNVLVCIPKGTFAVTSAYFVAAMINQQKWRYGYGRQCYKAKLGAMTIAIPWRNSGLDEDAMGRVVEGRPYSSFVQDRLGS